MSCIDWYLGILLFFVTLIQICFNHFLCFLSPFYPSFTSFSCFAVLHYFHKCSIISFSFERAVISTLNCFGPPFASWFVCSTPKPSPHFCLIGLIFWPAPNPLAWQGTDLMHNHVLVDVGQSRMKAAVCHASVLRLDLSSDQSEDSDYDSIWTTHSYRMVSTSRKGYCK